jgi:IPT/TIG domain
MARGKHVKGRVKRPVVESGGRHRVVSTDAPPEVGPLTTEVAQNGQAAPLLPALEATTGPRGGHVKTQGTVNRRKVLGLAAAGVASGSVLAENLSSTAVAATTTEPGAVAPDVVALTDGPTIVVNASLGNDFRVTIAASRTMGNPTNAADGQKIVFQITQGGAGSCTITWGSLYDFSTSLPQPTLSTSVGQTDLLAFIYNAALGKWLFVAFVGEFYPFPTVSNVSPNSGPTTGGTSITITGTGFLPGAKVTIGQGYGLIGGLAATVTSVTSTMIVATTSGGAKAGKWSLFVTTLGGTSIPTANDYFTYTS